MNTDFSKQFTPKWFYVFMSPAGKKYLGQTIEGIPGENYFGSGSYWTKHIKKHGKPVIVISKWCRTVEEFQQQLDVIEKHHPNYWNSDGWANQCSETPYDSHRYGSIVSDNTKNKLREAGKITGTKAKGVAKPTLRGRKQPIEVVEKRAATHRGSKRSTEARKNISLGKIGKPAHNKGKPSKSKGMTYQQVACPHCNKLGGITAMPRWHFNNCKFKENKIER